MALGRLLTARGHAVRVLAPAPHRTRVEAAGCEWRPFPTELEFDPTKGRALEDQFDFIISTQFGSRLPRALLVETERAATDVLIVDYMLESSLVVAEATSIPTAALVHTPSSFHSRTVGTPAQRTWTYERINGQRAKYGLDPLPVDLDMPIAHASMQQVALALAAIPAEFDEWETPHANVRHVGPLFEEDPAQRRWDPPWTDDDRPLAVVSFSTQYMHHEHALEKVADALTELGCRVLVTTGFELDPSEIHVPASVEVRRYIPHGAVLPDTALVVTHAGLGTIMAALTHGVPLVCMPLGRDQHGNADRVETIGAGRSIPADATVRTIREAARAVLHSSTAKATATEMARAIAGYGAGTHAIQELEYLADTTSRS
jgi:MGT family glycosyltransferase